MSERKSGKTPTRNESTQSQDCWVSGGRRKRRSLQHQPARSIETEFEFIRWDPKDGDLCLRRVKPEETLVEARNGADVQIARLTWV